jgi:hypothetical protein
MKRGIVRVRVGLSYDPLRLSPCFLICMKNLRLQQCNAPHPLTPQQQCTPTKRKTTRTNKTPTTQQISKTMKISVGHSSICIANKNIQPYVPICIYKLSRSLNHPTICTPNSVDHSICTANSVGHSIIQPHPNVSNSKCT